MPGVYIDDKDATLHVSNEELCEYLGVEYTRANAAIVEAAAIDALRLKFPTIATAPIEHRNDPA
jgi:hypothetical protein